MKILIIVCQNIYNLHRVPYLNSYHRFVMLYLLLLQVSPRKVGKNWSRRVVTIIDSTGTVRCKLWNDFDSIIDEGDHSGMVQLTNMEVDKWGPETSLTNTMETDLQVC